MNKYHDVDCCDNKGVDGLFANYEKDKNFIINLLYNDPDELINTIWAHDGPLCIDINCKCLMGAGDRRSPFSCSQCKNIGRLKDFRQKEYTFMIKCGENIGKTMIVIPSEISNLFLNCDEKASEKAQSYVSQHRGALTCGTNINTNTRCVSGDNFTIRILVMWMIIKKFKEKSMPHYLNLYTAFVCGNKGYSLMDVPTIGSLAILYETPDYHTSGISQTIFHQLVVSLNELSMMNFSHGNPSIEALVFGKEPVSYKYDGFHINGAITLKIIDMWNSSATFANVHYFSKDIKDELYMERNIFIPEFETSRIDGSQLYRLSSDNISLYMAIRSIGFPLFSGSFDMYFFMTSLMCDKHFYLNFMKDNKLKRIWKLMWLPEQFPKIEALIIKQHNLDMPVNNFENIINIIKGFWLRCDIIKYVWNMIKTK